MTYISFEYYLFLAVALAAYYALPLRFRWLALLAASASFYAVCAPGGLPLFAGLTAISYLAGLAVQAMRGRGGWAGRLVLAASLCAVAFPLAMVKEGSYILGRLGVGGVNVASALGMSFFTVQMIAYIADVWAGRVRAERSPLRYALFVSFFPQILQGPIPRFGQLAPQLIAGHGFDAANFTCGAQKILWGFFLKFMIADKAAVVVNAVFGNHLHWQGVFVVLAGMLYSVQLYADFLACTKLAQGAAMLFGIRLGENFNHPYFAESIKDFWRRWHMSFSNWLRDYIYIPLGGSRCGMLRRYVNIGITFLVSGMWHGSGLGFLVWGGLHALYQIAGEMTLGLRARIFGALGMPEGSAARRILRRAVTFALVTAAWIIFRATSLRQAIFMIGSVFTVGNGWMLLSHEALGAALAGLGTNGLEMAVLSASVGVLIAVSAAQERGVSIRQRINAQAAIVRWAIYIAAAAAIALLGTYGGGFNAQDFIYGGF